MERGGLSLSRLRLWLRLRDRPRLGALSICGERYGLSPMLGAVVVETLRDHCRFEPGNLALTSRQQRPVPSLLPHFRDSRNPTAWLV